MTKVVIYEEAEKEEPVVRLALRPSERGNGRTLLCAVDAKGKTLPGGILLYIEEDGTMKRAWGVIKSLGLSLDGDGRIQFKGG